MLREPQLFDAIAVHNPITDLLNYVIQQTQSTVENRAQMLQEFGDIDTEEVYKMVKMISPYHIPFYKNFSYQTDLMLTYDRDSVHEMHCRKFIAKMRDVNQKGDFMFIK